MIQITPQDVLLIMKFNQTHEIIGEDVLHYGADLNNVLQAVFAVADRNYLRRERVTLDEGALDMILDTYAVNELTFDVATASDTLSYRVSTEWEDKILDKLRMGEFDASQIVRISKVASWVLCNEVLLTPGAVQYEDRELFFKRGCDLIESGRGINRTQSGPVGEFLLSYADHGKNSLGEYSRLLWNLELGTRDNELTEADRATYLDLRAQRHAAFGAF